MHGPQLSEQQRIQVLQRSLAVIQLKSAHNAENDVLDSSSSKFQAGEAYPNLARAIGDTRKITLSCGLQNQHCSAGFDHFLNFVHRKNVSSFLQVVSD